MKPLRTISRRSFLASVAGGGLILGGLFAGAGRGAAQTGTRQMIVDADPRDPARERPPPSPPRPADTDAGPNSDTAGRGKPPARASGQAERFVVCPGNPRCPT